MIKEDTTKETTFPALNFLVTTGLDSFQIRFLLLYVSLLGDCEEASFRIRFGFVFQCDKSVK